MNAQRWRGCQEANKGVPIRGPPSSIFEGPVESFVSTEQGTLFACQLGHAVLEQDGEVIQRCFQCRTGIVHRWEASRIAI